MGKLWNIIKVTASVLVIVFLVVTGIVYHLSGKAEDNLQRAYAYSNSNDWENAFSSVEKIPYYKNASELYTYLYPIKKFYEKYDTREATLKNYEDILFYINTERETIKKLGDEKYLKDINELEKMIGFKTNIMNVIAQDESLRKNLNEGLELLKQGNLDQANERFNTLSGSLYDLEKNELVLFVGFLRSVQTGDKKLIMPEIAKLNPSYAGIYSAEIKQAVQAYANPDTWGKLYAEASGADKQGSATEATVEGAEALPPPPPQIQRTNIKAGMTKEEIITTFGTPASESIITSRFGVFGEMVYGGRVVYIEDNKVIVVK